LVTDNSCFYAHNKNDNYKEIYNANISCVANKLSENENLKTILLEIIGEFKEFSAIKKTLTFLTIILALIKERGDQPSGG
jgi:hypothetical protein